MNRLTTYTLGLALLGLSACSIPNIRPEAKNAGDIGQGEVVVVGSVVLDPAMGPDEQVIARGINMDQMKYAALAFGPGPYQGEDEPGMGVYEGAISVPFGAFFFSKFDPEPITLRMLIYTTSYSVQASGRHNVSSDWRRAFMPANRKLDLRDGDQVVYIGKLVFKRDEFNSPKGLVVLDEYDRALPAIRKRFGHGVKVRKALLKTE